MGLTEWSCAIHPEGTVLVQPELGARPVRLQAPGFREGETRSAKKRIGLGTTSCAYADVHAAGTQDSHTLTQAAGKIALFQGVFSMALQYEGRSRLGVKTRPVAIITHCRHRAYSECTRRRVAHPATGKYGLI